MRVHFLYQIFILIKLFDIWERLQGTLFLQFVRFHSVFQEIFSFYFLKLVIFPYFWHNRYMKLTIQRMARIAIYRIAKYSAYYSYVFCGCSLFGFG